MAKGDAEYRRLQIALTRTTPNCDDDTRFIQDQHSAWDAVDMRGLCRECPLLTLCRDVATTMPYTSGWWAGKQYGRPNRRTQGEDEQRPVSVSESVSVEVAGLERRPSPGPPTVLSESVQDRTADHVVQEHQPDASADNGDDPREQLVRIHPGSVEGQPA